MVSGLYPQLPEEHEINKVVVTSGPVQVLVFIQVDYRALSEYLLKSLNIYLFKERMFLMKDDVRYVDRAGPFVPEFLLQLEEAILDLFFDVERQLPFGAEQLAVPLRLLLAIINI